MRFLTIPLAVLTPCVVAMAAAPQGATMWDFEDATVGQIPSGWYAAKTGDGEGSIWKALEDPSAPQGAKVLAQTAAGPGPLFNLCVANDTEFQDVELSVSFKAVRGKIDQGGGLVWRYADANNYYIARFNPLEDNYRLYKVVNGKRTQLASMDNLKVPAGPWHKMAVTMKGDHIECAFNGEGCLDGKDGTFTKAGRVGLWTKADAQTYFDEVQVSEAR